MTGFYLFLAFLLGPAAGEEGPPAWGRTGSERPFAGRQETNLQEEGPRVRQEEPLVVRLGLRTLPLPFPVRLSSVTEEFGAEWDPGFLAWEPSTLGAPALFDVRDPRTGVSGSAVVAYRRPQVSTPAAASLEGLTVVADESARVLPADSLSLSPQEEPSFLRSEFADLEVQLRGRGEFGGDWTRFQPCQVGLQESCDPGLFPQLQPDIQFGLQVSGTVADRIHVDVDYDETREFQAVNNVNLYYEGVEGAFLQRVEVGDVTLTFPESRFLTQGIPAGNFGFRAVAGKGPVELQTVWAQQNGDISSREYQLGGVGGRQAFIQEDTLVLDDADFVRGQFFFLVDPRQIDRFPHIDILALDPGAAAPSVAPGADPIQLYRFENDPVTRQQVEGYIQARAVAEQDGVEVEESGWFRYLQTGQDYLLHPSGLWVALRRPLRQDEMLAATFVTAVGDTVGDYNPERIHNEGGRPTLQLLKASGPKHQPGSPTWEQEMHQVYRISSSNDVETSSVALTISLGELSAGRTFRRRPTGEEITLLKLMGLDEESPVDQLDPSFLMRPSADFFQDPPRVNGTFIVFPTLRPFAEPPPVASLNLSAAETKAILGADGNTRIYDAVDPVEREAGGLYRLTIPFRIRSEGIINSFSLGALGIRDGSERIRFGEQLLQSGEDYFIDYDIGQVTLLNPEALFSSAPNARIRASWEQKALFQIAPTAIFGFNARYGLGDRGAVHLLGLYQKEQTLQNRPQLGMEPASIFLGGINGDLSLGASWLDRLSSRLPGAGADEPARLDVSGELALSVPNPNTRGDVYLDDFEASNELRLSLRSRDWHLGSAPEERDGLGSDLPLSLGAENALGLVWQDSWILQGAGGDSLGIFEGFFPRRDIDEQINIAGTETREVGLRLTFGREQGTGSPDAGWRSMTSVLSTTGTDLTRSDFLEFYASGSETITLILDLGRVSEDAMFVDGQGMTSGTRPGGGGDWGLGFLDQEADPRLGQIWNDQLDEQGAWPEECIGARGALYPLGDPRANCTRSNGRNDTEDLDGDGNLFQGDRVYRYVVKLDGSSPFLARTRDETGSQFQLYRIPLRGPDGVNVGGRVTEADWRAVKHLRLTVVGPAGNLGVSLTRLKLIGSRWVKRGQEGTLLGWSGDVRGLAGAVDVGPVSSLSEGDGYASPPGVQEELDNPSQAFAGGGVEFNEKSLAIRFEDLQPGERAEVYSRFPQRPRNFLTYRELRIWVLGKEGRWGGDGGEFFLKVGTDSENFYLFRTSRPEAPPGQGVSPTDWLPEVLVDFSEWLALRREAEEALIREPPGPGAPPLEVWSADSTYAVFLKDRARAPNLAAVRELSMGIWNEGSLPLEGEVWVNDLRLDRPLRDTGLAGFMNVDLEAPGLFSTSVNYSGRGPFFRQLQGDPTFQGDAALQIYSRLELGRVVPETWGISMPVTVSHSDFSQEPTFLAQSDVRVDQVGGLRPTGTEETRVEVGFQKTTPTGNKLLDPFLTGLSLRAGYTRTQVSMTTLESNGSGVDARADYFKEVPLRDVKLVPVFAEGIARALLPRSWEESLLDARLRWTPEQVRVGTLFSRRRRTAYRYEQILAQPGDSAVTPTRSPLEALETTAQVDFLPLDAVSFDISFFSVRDLLSPERAIRDEDVQPLLADERARIAGIDLGWETRRTLRTRLGLRPTLASWLRTDFSVATDYASDRNAALVERLVTAGDTVVLLSRNANGNRTSRLSLALDPGDLVDALKGEVGAGEAQDSSTSGFPARMVSALDPLVLSRQSGLSARFFRDPVDPGAGFQFGLGGVDDFRFLGGDTASVFTGQTSWTGGTGVQLPLNLRVSGNFTEARTEILHARSDREIRTRTWPDVRVSVSEVRLPAATERFLERLSLTSGARRNTIRTTYGGRGVQQRETEEWAVPLEATASWVGGVTTRYSGTYGRGEGLDPTGATETKRLGHTFSLSSQLSDPPWLGDRLDGPLRVSLAYQYTSELNCRTPQGRTDCVPYLDFLNRSVNLRLDTVILPLEVGLHLTYTSRRSFVGQRDGSTQFQLGLFGQFVFESGAFQPPSPGGFGGGD